MKKVKFGILLGANILLALADGLLTFINTPDLSQEGNPLVSKLGLGWGALATANILCFILVFACCYYCMFRYQTRLNSQTNFFHYGSQILYDRPDRFWTGLIPKHITPLIAGCGYFLPYAWIAGRAVLVAEWLCVTYRVPQYYTHYSPFVNRYCFGRPDIIVGLIVSYIFLNYWLYQEFKKNLAALEAAKK